MWQPVTTVLQGLRRIKAASKTNFGVHTQSVIVTVWWSDAWPTTAFWILATINLEKYVAANQWGYTKNGNACSHIGHYRGLEFSTVMPDHTPYNHHLGNEEIELKGFGPSTIFTWPLLWILLLSRSGQLCRENTSTVSRMQKMFSTEFIASGLQL